MELPEFLQIPCLLMKDDNLNQLDWFVYALVHWYSKQALKRCMLKNQEIASLLRCSPGSVSNSIARLKNAGYIEVIGAFKNRTALIPLVTYSVKNRNFVPSTDVSLSSVPSTNGTVPSTDVESRGYLPTPNNNKEYNSSNEEEKEQSTKPQIDEVKSGLDTYGRVGEAPGAIIKPKKPYPGKKREKSDLELAREKRTREILYKIKKQYGIDMFITFNHQNAALIAILDHAQGEYDEDDIFGCINWLLEDEFWKSKGFDLRTVKNQMPKYKIAKRPVILPKTPQKSVKEIEDEWRKDWQPTMETEEFKEFERKAAENRKKNEERRKKLELEKQLQTQDPATIRSEEDIL